MLSTAEAIDRDIESLEAQIATLRKAQAILSAPEHEQETPAAEPRRKRGRPRKAEGTKAVATAASRAGKKNLARLEKYMQKNSPVFQSQAVKDLGFGPVIGSYAFRALRDAGLIKPTGNMDRNSKEYEFVGPSDRVTVVEVGEGVHEGRKIDKSQSRGDMAAAA